MSKEVIIKPIAQKPYVPKIINTKNHNAYGVLLHTRKSIEEFQEKSGMEGRYTKEYQHHYWAANARLAVDGQVLDISIPLILFNYNQTVTGGDIKFDLEDVTKVSKALEAAAKAKYAELKETRIWKYITEEIGITTWEFVPLNTAHVHPGGERQSFSGIDLRKEPKYPGIVYPLKDGQNIPSFSAIMAHIDGICRTVHSEYRIFSEAENGDMIYAHGRCATIVRGFTPEPLPRVEIPEPVAPKMIDKIFNITPPQPKGQEQKEAPERPNFMLKDNMEKEDGEEFLKELEAAWLETEFDPDTTMIIKDNIKSPVVQNFGRHNQGNLWNQQKQGGRDEEKKSGFVSVFDQKAAIVKYQLATWAELQGQTDKDIKDLYALVLLAEEEVEKQVEEFDRVDGIQFLVRQGYKREQLIVCTDEKLYALCEKEKEDDDAFEKDGLPSVIYNGVSYTAPEIEKIRSLLEDEQYLSFAKLNQMSDFNIISYYESFYHNGE